MLNRYFNLVEAQSEDHGELDKKTSSFFKPFWTDEIPISVHEFYFQPLISCLTPAKQVASIAWNTDLGGFKGQSTSWNFLRTCMAVTEHDRASTRIDILWHWGQVAAQSPVMSWVACSVAKKIEEMHWEATSLMTAKCHNWMIEYIYIYICMHLTRRDPGKPVLLMQMSSSGNHCWSARRASCWKRTLMPALHPEGW